MKHKAWQTSSRSRKAVAILRVSSHRQRDGDSHEVQRAAAQKYAEANGLEIVRYEEITESAKDGDRRQQFQAAYRQLLTESIPHVIFYMQDREARNLTDVERSETLAMEGKVVLHYSLDGKVIWQKSPSSDFLTRDLQAMTAKHFSRQLSERMTDVMKAKAESGEYPGNRPPLGYIQARRTDGRGKALKRGSAVEKDPDDANVKLVQREFELRAEGLSYQSIRDQVLRENLVLSSRKSKYRANAIEKRLTNPFYWGKFIWDGIEYDGNHELIIPAPILKAVDNLSGRRGHRPRPLSDQGAFAGGFLTCADPQCGCQVTYDPKKKTLKSTGETKIYPFYRCSNSKKVHPTMKGMNVSEDSIWRQLEKAVEAIQLSPELAERVLNALKDSIASTRVTTSKRIAELEKKLREIDDREDRLYSDYSDGRIGEPLYLRQSSQLTESRTSITAELARVKAQSPKEEELTIQSLIELAKNAKGSSSK